MITSAPVIRYLCMMKMTWQFLLCGLLIVGDHASNRVPAGVDLGIAPQLLDEHIAVTGAFRLAVLRHVTDAQAAALRHQSLARLCDQP